MKRFIFATAVVLSIAGSAYTAPVSSVTSQTGQLNTARFSGMTAPSNSDLLQGIVAVVGARGLHPGVVGNSTAALTDGNGNTPTTVLNDSAGALPVGTSTTLTFTLATTQTIGSLRVFSSNGDGRAFQFYDVQVASTNGGPYTNLITGVRVGTPAVDSFHGNDTSNNLSAISQVYDNSSSVLASNVKEVLITFWGCDNDFLGTNCVAYAASIQGANLVEIDALAPVASVQQEWSLYR
ncbi:MAG: hypothetical protein K1X53_01245 [Candidatus Sumerlaeaceae bacterium]|nr:hypothetical protein [Candidatus Sumerlaeaceae bacterium]